MAKSIVKNSGNIGQKKKIVKTDDLLKIAVKAVKEAGRIQLKYFKNSKIVKKKGKYDILAEADLRCEKAVLGMIRKEFPEHDILSEEKGFAEKGSEYMWVVDPLDGTENYSFGLPLFCVSISVMKNHKPVVGVIYLPFFDELFTAVKGKGAKLNGKKIKVSNRRLADGVVNYGITSKAAYRDKILKTIERSVSKEMTFRVLGSSAVVLSYVACGRIDGSVKNRFHWWDIGAGILLVKEAGGKITDMDGKKLVYDSKNVVVSNGKIHRSLLKAIK